MGAFKNWRLFKQRIICDYMQSMIKDRAYNKLGNFAKGKNDLRFIYEAIEFLYSKNQWDILDDLYFSSTQNQSVIQSYLLELYRNECIRLQRGRGLAEFYITYKGEEYTKRLDTMLVHTLSVKENIPEFGEVLTNLFIEGASISALMNRLTLILNHYPQKSNALGNALLTRNNLLQLEMIQTSDLPLVSYIFHSIETAYEQIQEGKYCFTDISQEQIVALYDKCKQLVMTYNQNMVNEFLVHTKEPSYKDFEQEIIQPGVPILSMLDVLNIQEEEKEQIILKTACSDEMKQILLNAFHNHYKNPEQIQYFDFYYVLYQNPIQQQLYLNGDLLRNQNIRCKNKQYLEKMKQKREMGYLNEEDIIGAIGSLDAYPVFGLFSLISDLSLEELDAIASNLTFETADMSKQLRAFLRHCKKVENPYNEEFQNLDVQYVREKIAYENMLAQTVKIKKKEHEYPFFTN